MKKIVFVFGSIAGLIFIVWMAFIYTACYDHPDTQANMWLGYGSMIVAFSFVFVGIKSYRDKYNNGHIAFWKAFQVGLYITLIASTIYVLAWLVDYYVFMPDFMDKYVAHTLAQAKSHGASAAELDKQRASMASYIQMYKSPFGVIVLTYLEVLPVGLVITLIAALILKRSNKQQPIIA
ncbi:DUF4199 domain-containing protein [Mucilaginibacter jinjuensis]|uniref:DUF4199 domain-containing protein n=1 Tax=Mucilaginibacter jinjuensis TaxID=1176721 RepID=A0ABY7T2B6_9SPHI|nr:DUF4199 domain-containing protein [Mucilaginibacter jinjuensis]WCT10531.1 DUF4199 domain-containing protein [Mucilaginibacter jinjuensis]